MYVVDSNLESVEGRSLIYLMSNSCRSCQQNSSASSRRKSSKFCRRKQR